MLWKPLKDHGPFLEFWLKMNGDRKTWFWFVEQAVEQAVEQVVDQVVAEAVDQVIEEDQPPNVQKIGNLSNQTKESYY